MKKILTLAIMTFLLSSVFAQEASIEIGHIGFGETAKQAVFTIHNTGEITLTDISVYVDGQSEKTFSGTLTSKKGIEFTLNLEEGEHAIEVRTPEGAYDSVIANILAAEAEEQVTVQSLLTQYQQPLALLVVIILVIAAFWVFTKKPKL